MASYATYRDLIERHDARAIGDLAGDLGARLDVPEMENNTRITRALTRASGQVETALLVGGRYTVEDLAGLTDNALEWLKGIVCDLAFVYLARRRGDVFVEKVEMLTSEAETELDAMRSGKRVLPIPENIAASVPTTGGPTLVEMQKLNLVRDRARGFFPTRRLPDDR